MRNPLHTKALDRGWPWCNARNHLPSSTTSGQPRWPAHNPLILWIIHNCLQRLIHNRLQRLSSIPLPSRTHRCLTPHAQCHLSYAVRIRILIFAFCATEYGSVTATAKQASKEVLRTTHPSMATQTNTSAVPCHLASGSPTGQHSVPDVEMAAMPRGVERIAVDVATGYPGDIQMCKLAFIHYPSVVYYHLSATPS